MPRISAPEPVISDHTLRAEVLRLAPDLPQTACARLRIIPAREPAWGDLSTDAALVAAAGQDRQGFAERLALRLRALPGIGSADATGSGYVNLRYSDAALAGILAAAAMRAADGEAVGTALVLPVAALDLSDPVVAIQVVHARCRSVLRAAQASGELPALAAGAMAAGAMAAGAFLGDRAERQLLCRVEHWLRIAPLAPSRRVILLYLRNLSDDFELVWKLGGDDATLRFLYPGDPGRSLAGLALVSATAKVVRTVLAMLGMVAAEELQ